jgi:hypothetical protein
MASGAGIVKAQPEICSWHLTPSLAGNARRSLPRSLSPIVHAAVPASTAFRGSSPVIGHGAPAVIAAHCAGEGRGHVPVLAFTLPGTDLISASADGSAPSLSSSSAAAARTARRVLASEPSRAVTRAVSACSAWCRAEQVIRSQRPADGGSIRSVRRWASSSSRTRSGRRSAWQALTASHSVSLPASSAAWRAAAA